MMIPFRVSLPSFALFIHMQLQLLSGVSSALYKTPEARLLRQGPGIKCEPSHDLSQNECIQAATSLGGVLFDNELAVGYWRNAPPGCSIATNGGRIFYNFIDHKSFNDGNYNPVCKALEDEATFSISRKALEEKATLYTAIQGNKCISGHDFSEDECAAAAASVGGRLRDGNIVVGDWSHTPPGCFIEPSDKGIHFGTKFGSVNAGSFHPVCRAETEGEATLFEMSKALENKATLYPAIQGIKCTPGHYFTKEQCIAAAKSVGGHLRNGRLIAGGWGHTPSGCFLEPSDNAIHFGTNIFSNNAGIFRSVCRLESEIIVATLLPNREETKCKQGHGFSIESCVAAASSVGGILRDEEFEVGDWTTTPPGCFIEAADKAIHFNRNVDGINAGYFQPVCIKEPIEAVLLPSRSGSKCTPYHDFSKEECIAAALSVGGLLRDYNLIVGDWLHTPYGCFVQEKDKAIHFGTNIDGLNYGGFQPVCIAESVKAVLLPARDGTKCTQGHDFSKEDCIAAAASVGGNLRDGKFITGSWPDAPPGCFIELSDGAIHFGMNNATVNAGNFQPVCIKGPVEATLLPAIPGMKCKSGHDISQEECMCAALSLGGNPRDDQLIIGGWAHTPSGCFIQEKDKAIHFGTNIDGTNFGTFQPVCITEKAKARLLPSHKGNKCAEGLDFSKDDCIAAALSAGGYLRDGDIAVGDWSYAPSGCFIKSSDKAIHFGTNIDGINNGYFRPVCIPEPVKATLLPPRQGSSCLSGSELTEEQCCAAAELIGGNLRGGKFIVGDWSNTPSGCFLDASDKAIHFGKNVASINNGSFQPVCAAKTKVALLPSGKGLSCTEGRGFTKEDCFDAALSVGGIQRDDQFMVGDFANAPPGCSIEVSDNAIHFGTSSHSINNGNFRPVCIPAQGKATLLSARQSTKCTSGHYFSEDECKKAGLSVGGKLRNGEIFVGNWLHTPSGCFLDTSDEAIGFGTNTAGINNGAFQPVCIVDEVEATLYPAYQGNKCSPGYNFKEDYCVEAASSVGGILRSGRFLVGDWPDSPYGCFIDASDGAIHFGRNVAGINDGSFQPVCVPEEDEALLLPSLRGKECTQGHDFSEEECISAASSVGGSLRNGQFLVGNWPNTPYGCFIDASDKAIHFGTNMEGTNNGYFRSVCIAGDGPVTLLPPGIGAKCTPGHDFSEEQCIAAASSVGGLLRDGKFIVGDW
eukprot:CAMPEP_0194353096 /NCGR_PEP_ID=MMETSP0174-20130528/1440_1 /TAXON_ID=216777 /ORGANISM="Proboscia alata, Strain PI-D3" /LENGTH=1200 /DNA_ID=CAMNT_0039121471 /DNA_START=74 /DNA_END=3673 /DNA_ORIENTATION=+